MLTIQTIVSEQTLIPIGIAFAVLAPVCGWLIWLNGRLADIRAELVAIRLLYSETWSFNQMQTWTLKLKNRNPHLDIPDPEPPTVAPRRPNVA